MSSYTIEYEITDRYRARVTVASGEGQQEAIEAFWLLYHRDVLDPDYVQTDGPQNVQVYRG